MKKGFFDIKETSIIRGDEIVKSKIKKPVIYSCSKCGLSNTCNSPKMKLSGNGKLGILIINENPGKTEDEKNKQFSGKTGQLLKNIILELRYDLYDDFYFTNAVKCHTTNKLTNIQINACRKYLQKDIERINPKVIITLGKVSIEALIGHRLQGRISGCSIVDWVNTFIPDQELKKWICPTWDLLSVYKKGKNEDREDLIIKNQIKNTIQKAIELSKQPFYSSNYLSDCIPIYDKDKAIEIIEEFTNKEYVSFDYETTGKKPHREGHHISCVSLSDGLFSYSFPYFNDKKFRKRFIQFLDSNVKKICHNGKFENLWSIVRGGFNDTKGIEINNFYWDTMLGGHSLYNNKKTNLKFYTYIHFGVLGYDSDIDPYLEALPKEVEIYGANAINRIDESPLDKKLLYNAADSLFTFKEYEYQKEHLEPHLRKGAKFFFKGSMALSELEQNGIVFNEIEAKKEYDNLQNKMDLIEQKILKSEELKKWDKDKQFRISAPQDITHLLFNILKYEVKETTLKSNKPKSDIESLKKYKIPIVKDCLEWRRWQKINNTYLKGFIRESHNNILHSFYNLNFVSSFRSSSSDPNFQNIPKHDEEAAKLLRKLLGPRKGNILGEYDYGAMEVKIIACCNKDPNLIKYIESGKDPHRGFAAKLFLMSIDEVMKNEGYSKNVRYVTKNSFIFPTFYGSWYKNTASQLYENCEKETRIYLKKQGIYNLDDYINHVKKVEQDFWNEFNVGYEWKEKTVKTYNKNGYIDTLNGFRFQGPMTNNEILNYQVQGPAFHCLLWTLIKLLEQIKKRRMQTIIDGQIHDSIYPDFPPEEEEELDYLIWYYGTQKIREYWDWLIVPLQIEKGVSDINGNWANMSKGVILNGK
ncbi:MAG: DNA polymerase [Candidatus Nanoarchaeia archaeon]|jgi:DNA polymerase-1|nr:DNA polymerase [Candidatus Nanoarchaeia archaeon]